MTPKTIQSSRNPTNRAHIEARLVRAGAVSFVPSQTAANQQCDDESGCIRAISECYMLSVRRNYSYRNASMGFSSDALREG